VSYQRDLFRALVAVADLDIGISAIAARLRPLVSINKALLELGHARINNLSATSLQRAVRLLEAG